MIRSFSIIFGLEYLRLACSRRLGRYQQKTPRAVMAQGEQLSRSARVWTLGRFPFDSGRLWAALRPCARVLPSARPAVDACHWQAPPLASVQAPSQPHATRFFLSAVPPEFGPCPHSCPVTAGGRRAISCPGSGGPFPPRLRGTRTARPLSDAPCAGYSSPSLLAAQHFIIFFPACQAAGPGKNVHGLYFFHFLFPKAVI